MQRNDYFSSPFLLVEQERRFCPFFSRTQAHNLWITHLARQVFSYYDLGMSPREFKGVPVNDEQIQAWADEAEAGYSVEHLRKRGRQPLGYGPSTVVPVRLDADLLDALGARAEAEHVSRSEAIRAAIRAWLGAA